MNDHFALLAAEALRTQEAKEERAHVRVWVGRILVLLAVLVTTVYATGAYADTYSVKAQNGDSITLMDTPCTQGEWFKLWKAARFVYQGRSFEACWRVEDTMVLVLDAEGDLSSVPMQAFSKDEGV